MLSIIVAYSKDPQQRLVIGRDNTLPWHSKKDLTRFREYTSGHPIIMGRKTFESVGRPLPRRENIVVTHQKNFQHPGVLIFHDIETAIRNATAKSSEVFVIGGQQIYEQTIDRVDRLYITEFRLPQIKGDAFFPKFKQGCFKVFHKEESGEEVFTISQRIKIGQSCLPEKEDESQESKLVAEPEVMPYNYSCLPEGWHI